jgi:hypothetical protein
VNRNMLKDKQDNKVGINENWLKQDANTGGKD